MMLWVALGLGGSAVPSISAARPTLRSGVHQPASVMGLRLGRWVTASRDNGKRPFIVIDKATAEVLVFDSRGLLTGIAPALVGIAQGDEATPGVGEKELSEIGPAEKTTPAGRYLARIGPAKGIRKVLWIDFNTSVALHPVITTDPREQRIARLRSATRMDNRITFGCINVPTVFFDKVVLPSFRKAGGMVYILPEQKFMADVFPSFHIFVSPGIRSARTSHR